MKKLAIIVLLFEAVCSYSQGLTGTWVGIHTSNLFSGGKLVFYERFYLKQKGSFVWGVVQQMSHLTKDSSFDIDKAQVLCEYTVSGEIPYILDSTKKISLYRGKTTMNNIPEPNIQVPLCDFTFYFDAIHSTRFNAEFLSGKWYPSYHTPRDDGARGGFALKKISSVAPNFVDSHFSRLDKILQKYFKKDSAYLVKIGVYDKIFTPQAPDLAAFDSLISAESILRDSTTQITADRREDIVQKIIDIDSSFIKIDLYDNGIVDDDTVSVYLNGSKIVNSRRLTEKALHMELELDDKEENELKLLAENLGEIPPNTALMIVTIGDKRIEVNLSASMSNNAVVIFRKSKKPS